jgi:hypothetical protein
MQLIRRQAIEELVVNPNQQQDLRVVRADGAEHIASGAAPRAAGGMMSRLAHFALGE